ncbi:hypothetical protein K438DRAFT_2104046 [Mycena galopus ATCC 62051]|nr:hypothetical protein K438DRAFT_2104046 [Mycena galopus ATCC 62051]
MDTGLEGPTPTSTPQTDGTSLAEAEVAGLYKGRRQCPTPSHQLQNYINLNRVTFTEEHDAIFRAAKTHDIILAAPFGVGKTTILEAIVAGTPNKHTLILTRGRLQRQAIGSRLLGAGCKQKQVTVETLSTFANRLFPRERAWHSDGMAGVMRHSLGSKWCGDDYTRVVVDEFQDCTREEYYMIYTALKALPHDVRLIFVGNTCPSLFASLGGDSRYLGLADRGLFRPTRQWKSFTLGRAFRTTCHDAAFINNVFLSGQEGRFIAAHKPGRLPIYIYGSCFMLNNIVYALVPLIEEFGREGIAILMPSTRNLKNRLPGQLLNTLSECGYDIVHPASDDTPLDPAVFAGKIAVANYHQFQGLERPVVVVFGLDESYFKRTGWTGFYPSVWNPDCQLTRHGYGRVEPSNGYPFPESTKDAAQVADWSKDFLNNQYSSAACDCWEVAASSEGNSDQKHCWISQDPSKTAVTDGTDGTRPFWPLASIPNGRVDPSRRYLTAVFSTAVPFNGRVQALLRQHSPFTHRKHVPVPALCPQPDTVTPTPTPTPTPSPTPALTSTRATYADVMACPTTDPVATSAVAADRHARMNPRAKPERAKERAHSLAPDLVFRVDSVRAEYNIPVATLTQPHPALLFRSIEGKSAILGDLKLASIRWTVKGNLTFAFVHDEQFSIEEAKKRAWTIWDHVCPLLNFPKNCDPNMAITLDTGEPWHNIVIHSVPLPGAVVDGPPLPNIFSWLRCCGVAGEINTVSFMCSNDDLGKRDKAPLRVSLSSQGDADMLCLPCGGLHPNYLTALTTYSTPQVLSPLLNGYRTFSPNLSARCMFSQTLPYALHFSTTQSYQSYSCVEYYGRNLPTDHCPDAVLSALTRAKVQLILVHCASHATMPFVRADLIREYTDFRPVDETKVPRRGVTALPLTLPTEVCVSDLARNIPSNILEALIEEHLTIIVDPPTLSPREHIIPRCVVTTDWEAGRCEDVGNVTSLIFTAAVEQSLNSTILQTLDADTSDLGTKSVPEQVSWLARVAIARDTERSGCMQRKVALTNHRHDWITERDFLRGCDLLRRELAPTGTERASFEVEFSHHIKMHGGNTAAEYGYLYACERGLTELPSTTLFNLLDGGRIEIMATVKSVEAMNQKLLQAKYERPVLVGNDNDFLDNCRKIREIVDNNFR